MAFAFTDKKTPAAIATGVFLYYMFGCVLANNLSIGEEMRDFDRGIFIAV